MSTLTAPSKEDVKAARERAGLTQEAAAALIHKRRERWAEYEIGRRNMGLDAYTLFLLMTNQHPTLKTIAKNENS